MNDPIPHFVDTVLKEWDFIAFFAYDNFESGGRGVVGLMEEEDGTKALYGPQEFFLKQGDQHVISLLAEYDPNYEFLVQFDETDGIRTIRIRTPEGGSHPRRIWFFEMLRRTSEAPDELPDILPNWFIEACDKIEKSRK